MNRFQQIVPSLKRLLRYYRDFYALSVTISFSLLVNCWLIALIYVWSVVGICQEFKSYVAVGAVVVTIGGLILVFHGFTAAKRVADIHGKLENVCRQWEEKESLDARLELGKTEGLIALENAYNCMADAMSRRI